MAHSSQAIPVSSASMAVQNFGGSDERQEVTDPIPESASPSGYNVTTSSTQAIAANSARVGVFVQNVSDVDIWLGIGGAAVVDSGLRLQAGDWIELRWQGAVNALHGSSGIKRLAFTDFSTS